MFSKISRYGKVPDTITVGNGGYTVSKTLRPLPDVSGTFQHIIKEGDRLDHLACQYYRESRKWWRICDSNRDFMSPQALLGKESIVTARFHITSQNQSPDWCDLLRKLSLPGIDSVEIEDEIPSLESSGQISNVKGEHFELAVLITFNNMNLKQKQIVDIIHDAGFIPGEVTDISRVGKQLIIPPNLVI